jgi:hypothetical protein
MPKAVKLLDFIQGIGKEYYSDIGEGKLSPLTKASLGLSLRYIKSFCNDEKKQPLFLCFPSKMDVSVYLSCGILIDFFFHDYYNQSENRLDELDLRTGDKIRIFGELTTWHNGKIKVTQAFTNEFGRRERREFFVPLRKSYLSHINRNKSEAKQIVSIETFNRKVSELRKNKNAISKILSEEKEELGINKGLLESKVLLVTGRGNAGLLRKVLKSQQVYSETLAEIFSEGSNLLLSPDLENYKAIFDAATEQGVRDYQQLFKAVYQRFSGNEIIDQDLFGKLKGMVDRGQFQTEEFVQAYDRLINDVSEEDKFAAFVNLKANYPGVLKSISKLRAVVINDVTLYEGYKTTISGLLNRGIPVVIICDRNIDSSESAGFYLRLFNEADNAYRINWNRKKIRSLLPIAEQGVSYLDRTVWQTACKYAQQKIKFRTFSGGVAENIISTLPKAISALEGFERLKEYFWKYMFPVGFIIKNTPGRIRSVKSLVSEFNSIYNEVSSQLNASLREQIDEAVDVFTNYTFNEKCVEGWWILYYQELGEINGFSYSIPFANVGCQTTKNLSEYTRSIVFTGFPYKEWSYHILTDAICRFFIPEIKLLLWRNESSVTYHYIRARVAASYFLDMIPGSWNFPTDLLLTDKKEIEAEIDELLEIGKDFRISAEKEYADFFGYDPAARHRRYLVNSQDIEEGYAVKCNVIHFEEEEYMYLPHRSTVLAMVDSLSDKISLKKCDFGELAPKFTVFVYRLDTAKLRELARNNPKLFRAFINLETWKSSLKNLYDCVNRNLASLEILLNDVKTKKRLKGNPNRSNIRRWLFDDNLISPEDDNLEVLLYASGVLKQDDIDDIIQSTNEASRDITGFSISMSSRIQNYIIEYANRHSIEVRDRFTIKIEGVSVEIESRTITGLEKGEYLIDYSDTRKILS